jgi:hypothetical protein
VIVNFNLGISGLESFHSYEINEFDAEFTNYNKIIILLYYNA